MGRHGGRSVDEQGGPEHPTGFRAGHERHGGDAFRGCRSFNASSTNRPRRGSAALEAKDAGLVGGKPAVGGPIGEEGRLDAHQPAYSVGRRRIPDAGWLHVVPQRGDSPGRLGRQRPDGESRPPSTTATGTYFNGELVGALAEGQAWSSGHVNNVPGKLVRAGRNVIAVRVLDVGNRGGFMGTPESMNVKTRGRRWARASPSGDRGCAVSGIDTGTIPPRPVAPAFLPGNPNAPTVLYNAMISPILPMTMRGAIWYQGESNAGRAEQYRTLFPTMIRNWRESWGEGDFPFIFVQLANFMDSKPEPGEDAWAELRERANHDFVAAEDRHGRHDRYRRG